MERTTIGGDDVTIICHELNVGTYIMNNGNYIWVEQIGASCIRVWMCAQEVYTGRTVTASFTTR